MIWHRWLLVRVQDRTATDGSDFDIRHLQRLVACREDIAQGSWLCRRAPLTTRRPPTLSPITARTHTL